MRWPGVWPSSTALEEGARWPAVRTADEPDSGKDGVERSGTEPPGRLTALRRGREILHFVQKQGDEGGNNEEAPGLYDSGLPKNRSDLLSQLVGQYHQRD